MTHFLIVEVQHYLRYINKFFSLSINEQNNAGRSLDDQILKDA